MYIVSVQDQGPGLDFEPIRLPSIDMARGCAIGISKALALGFGQAVVEITSEGELIESALVEFLARYDYKFAGEDE